MKVTRVAVLSCLLGCAGRIAPNATVNPYPSGDEAAVYAAALDKMFEGITNLPSVVVLDDSTTMVRTEGTAAKTRWTSRAISRDISMDSTAIESFVAANRIRLPIRPDLRYSIPIKLLSKMQMKALEDRGRALMEKARNTNRPTDFIPFWVGFYDEYPGSHGVIGFSRVGFNRSKTQALIEFQHGCGSLCGEGGFMVLEKTPAGWRVAAKIVEMVS